jgi:hypothetical protein
MKRQILIRGAAIAFAGVAASVFAAQQFMGPNAQTARMTTPGASEQVKSASLMGASAPTTPNAVAQQDLAFTAPEAPAGTLDLSQADIGPAESSAPFSADDQIAALDTFSEPTDRLQLTNDAQAPMTLAQMGTQANDGSCLTSLTAVPAIDALVDVRLTAPCAPNARIVFSHGDLAFSAYTDETGSFAAYVPALGMTANIEAFLPDQTLVQAQAIVPDAAQHVRVVVQWTGNDGVMLHAFHRDAAYGQAGHIHASRPFDPDMDGAFVLSLGESRGPEPMLSQVYSIPTTMLDQTRLELEVAVTPQNCGRDVTAYIAKTGSGQTGILEELTLAMPECSSANGMLIVPLALVASMQANLVQPPALSFTQN